MQRSGSMKQQLGSRRSSGWVEHGVLQVTAGNGVDKGDRGLHKDRNPSVLSGVSGTRQLSFKFHKCPMNYFNSLSHSIVKAFVTCVKRFGSFGALFFL